MKKRSVRIAGHPTSISLEEEFWQSLQQIASAQGKSLTGLITDIDEARGEKNLSSALRIHILNYFRSGAGVGTGAAD